MEKNLTILFFIMAGFILLLILLNCTWLPAQSDSTRTQHITFYTRIRTALQEKHIISDLTTVWAGLYCKPVSIVRELINSQQLVSMFTKLKYFHEKFTLMLSSNFSQNK